MAYKNRQTQREWLVNYQLQLARYRNKQNQRIEVKSNLYQCQFCGELYNNEEDHEHDQTPGNDPNYWTEYDLKTLNKMISNGETPIGLFLYSPATNRFYETTKYASLLPIGWVGHDSNGVKIKRKRDGTFVRKWI